jgi:hypothetical protein
MPLLEDSPNLIVHLDKCTVQAGPLPARPNRVRQTLRVKCLQAGLLLRIDV